MPFGPFLLLYTYSRPITYPLGFGRPASDAQPSSFSLKYQMSSSESGIDIMRPRTLISWSNGRSSGAGAASAGAAGAGPPGTGSSAKAATGARVTSRARVRYIANPHISHGHTFGRARVST